MASKVYVALILCLNLFSFTMVSSNYVPSTWLHQKSSTCPIDTLKLGVCAEVLNLVNAKLGAPPTLPCCNLIKDIADLEVASCLCTALKANVLGIKLDIPLSLNVILNNCGKNNSGFKCS
ncbi:unnamed protein product [Lupinus luteus]|uniref:Bifunctional inhibitor/plant lipid transfer protein/seed storage helical domain-containing protein n=1 Tax=Lupinus luteus TaxID=3873 RepID=A0AAV1WIK8_LUPLU